MEPLYKVVEGKAYTEANNTLVFNVFAYNPGNVITKDEIFNHFKQFGEIKEVQLLNEKKSFVVKFTHPEDALKCLKGIHTINDISVQVNACHSWPDDNQTGDRTDNAAILKRSYGNALPDDNHTVDMTDNAAILKRSYGNAFPDDNHTGDRTDNTAILKLNDDCLEMIFKKLSLLDQLNLALTCRRLTESFVIFSTIEYKTLNSYQLDGLSIREISQFVQIIGSQIDNVNVDGGIIARILLNPLGEFCTNLKKLIIKSVFLPTYKLYMILVRNMSITELEFRSTALDDHCVSIISKMPNLKSLSFSEDSITGRYIKDLVNLESLSLYNCSNFESCHFKEICENLKTLRILKFVRCTKLPYETTVEHIVKHLNELETLEITGNLHQIQRIAELPKLKHLLLDECHHLPSSLFSELAAHLNNQLETLCFKSNCLRLLEVTHIAELRKLKTLMCRSNTGFNDECLKRLAVLQDLEVINFNGYERFTDKGVLDLIKNCRKLRIICLPRRVRLGDTFASEVFNLYKNRSIKPLTILKFMPMTQKDIMNLLTPLRMLLFDRNSYSENSTKIPECKDKVRDTDAYRSIAYIEDIWQTFKWCDLEEGWYNSDDLDVLDDDNEFMEFNVDNLAQ